MTKNHRKRRAAVSLGAMLAAAAPALAADSLSDSVERFLDNAQTKVEETKLWKFQIRPTWKESLIWTDNVDLNDDDENPVHLTSVVRPSRTVRGQDRLERIADAIPDFDDTETQGRRDDFIVQSELGAKLVMPVNPDYSKMFRVHDEMTVLDAKIRNQEYLDHNELDNNAYFLRTDVFGFLSDVFNQEWGNHLWVRVRDEFSDLNDPLDAEIRLLRGTGLQGVHRFNDFGRRENTANFDAGWNGGRVDASVGYENYHLWLNDRDLDQAQHGRHNFHGEVGMLFPGWEEQRAYVRYDQTIYHFSRAPIHGPKGVTGEAQILNDAVVNKGTLGLAGQVTEKFTSLVEGIYQEWSPGRDGLTADRSHFAGGMAHVQFAYSPWEEHKNSKVQFDYHRDISYSAISNFNSTHVGTLSVLHEAIPDRLDVDFSIAYSTTTPSDGPVRRLFETGVGATYHLYKQLDVTFRYAFRHQVGDHEIITPSAFARNGRVYNYVVESESSFVQNTVEVGFLLHF